ncbi:hydrogenase expression/formation protein [Salipiger sp. PrR002]|uniref:hydrogenase expression/formation protein n=1 Tax=Salipiger sp. PrR002 TaxID=2706489 RepID=UPI0013B9A5F3|nr:hydrogenase expression/formation protein [Salipiger sp. PrR002]NDV97723.1 hydrogenase expression/formation protein [Salipiger sp. PrR002]NDW55214.1 hydrogenase expression/formation protein [Salipiger sp. PrR004]
MVSNFHLPPVGYGPGSQPEDEAELQYMSLPQDMRTFTAHVPDVEASAALAPAMGLLAALAEAAERVAAGGAPERFDLSPLDAANRRLVADTMLEGEVAMKIRGIPAIRVQESVFAGVWMLSGAGLDAIEIGAVPGAARSRAFEPSRRGSAEKAGAGVVNAPALLAELLDKSAAYAGATHVVNMTLLPHTEGDLAWLDARLGEGSVDILSRGYGNCRVTATATPHVWRVRFYNSMDQQILDTFEVTAMPEVALAAPEDLTDSAERLREVLEAIR